MSQFSYAFIGRFEATDQVVEILDAIEICMGREEVAWLNESTLSDFDFLLPKKSDN